MQIQKFKYYQMSESGIFLEYKGPVDYAVTDLLLKKIKKTREFTTLNKITGKRVYALVVECLENICKNPVLHAPVEISMHSHISVSLEKDKIIIIAGNPIRDSDKLKLAEMIDRINNMDEINLKTLYEHKMNRELVAGENGAGLGFIYMVLKSGNKIEYKFQPLTNGYLDFEIKISVNKYIMRKLIIEKTTNSPLVVLDPEKKTYSISGESRPPDVREFYSQIILWLEEFSSYLLSPENHNDPVIFNFNFEYFNSSSAKLILDICKILAGLRLKGVNIIVKWFYEKEDGDMLEVGKEMSRIVKFPFEFIESEIT